MAAQPKHEAPHGMEPYDQGSQGGLGALSAEQQQKLNKFKIQTRMENEKYLRQKPEVESLLAAFLGEILIKRPENVREFAAGYFTDPALPAKLETILQDRQQALKTNKVLKKMT